MSVANGVDYKVGFELDDLDFYVKHPKADMSNVYKIRINGKVYLAADEVLEITDKNKEEHAKYDRLLNPMWLRGYFDAQDEFREKVETLWGDKEWR